MGLFSSIGKALKGIGKVAGFIPGIGGTISKIAGTVGGVLDHKKPLSSAFEKARLASKRGGVSVLRGNMPQAGAGSLLTAQGMRGSPVMPGGAVAGTNGISAANGTPPRTYGGKSSGRKTTRKAKARPKARKAARRSSSKRKLKFGSAAYRKKYLGHR